MLVHYIGPNHTAIAADQEPSVADASRGASPCHGFLRPPVHVESESVYDCQLFSVLLLHSDEDPVLNGVTGPGMVVDEIGAQQLPKFGGDESGVAGASFCALPDVRSFPTAVVIERVTLGECDQFSRVLAKPKLHLVINAFVDDKRGRVVGVIELGRDEVAANRDDESCLALAPPGAPPDISPVSACTAVEAVTTDNRQLLTSLVPNENN
ncbi:unnamed protein product, partial [Iphiclides podalirius]